MMYKINADANIDKNIQNRQFVGQTSKIKVDDVSVAVTKSKNKNMLLYMLELQGKIKVDIKGEEKELFIPITECNYKPMFVNKSQDNEFFIFAGGIVKSLMDKIGINKTTDFVGKEFNVINNKKGFWMISLC